MATLVWVLQILLAVVFVAAGLVKLLRPKAELRAQMGWVDDYPDNGVKAIGAVEVLAAIGLILPALTGIATVFVPLAALGLVLLMIGAAITHGRRKEYPFVAGNVVLLIIALIVAWTRFGAYSL
ncbi:MAG TPA: DoxX family protein [Pseudonocardia sp.]|nr:DoxX family protein [Pseudonocardia sp.]